MYKSGVQRRVGGVDTNVGVVSSVAGSNSICFYQSSACARYCARGWERRDESTQIYTWQRGQSKISLYFGRSLRAQEEARVGAGHGGEPEELTAEPKPGGWERDALGSSQRQHCEVSNAGAGRGSAPTVSARRPL